MIFFITSCQKVETPSKDKSKVLAKVNNENITAYIFSEKTKDIQKHLKVNMDILATKKKILDNLIVTELIYQKALKEKFDKEIEFKDYITTNYLKRLVPPIEISDEEAMKYYKENQAQLDHIRAAHILIMPDKKGGEEADKEAKKQAAEILVLLMNGQDFSKLAKNRSQDPGNAKKGGDLGFFNYRRMVKEFSKAAFELKEPGDISKIVKTQFGYHIIKLLDNRRGFETFKEKIKERLSIEKNRGAYNTLITKLKSEAKIEIFENELKELNIVSEPLLNKKNDSK